MTTSPSPRPALRRHLPASAVLVFLAAMATPNFCPAQTTNLMAVDAITLSTKTPLGDASITLPAGAPLERFEIQGENIKVWQGPFTAVLPLTATTTQVARQPAPEKMLPSAPVAAATTAPTSAATPAPTPTAATPATAGAPDSAAAAKALLQSLSLEKWPVWSMPAALGALALYALFSTIAWLRSRRKNSAPRNRTAPLPVIIMPKQSARPAEFKDDGRAITCPLCGDGIPVEKLRDGRNVCPSCRESFVCA